MFTSGTVVYILSHSVIGLSLLFGSHTFAPSVIAGLDPLKTQLTDFVTSVQGILSGIGVAVAVIGIMVGGLMRATAFGNERKVAISNQAIACAVVGLAIVLVANTAATALQTIFK